MSTVFQWIHLSAAVIGVGGMAFLLMILFPSARVLSPDQRDVLVKAVAGRFRWVSWAVIALLLGSGLYNVSLVWEAPWGTYWAFLAVKIAQHIAPDNYDLAVVAAVAAILGHVFPIWLGFRGGKGVASALGVTITFNSNDGD